MEFGLHKLFNIHLCTPPTKSSTVHQDLEKLFKADGDIQLDLNQEFNFLEDLTPFKTVDYLKYISRKHGLPNILSSFLLTKFKSDNDDIPIRIKFQISQTLKYCIEKNNNFLTFTQLLDSLTCIFDFVKQSHVKTLNNLGSPNSSDLQIFQGIFSQLVECIGLKIKPENFDQSIIPQLEKFIPYINIKTRGQILNCLERWNVSISNTKLVQNSVGLNLDKDDILEEGVHDLSLGEKICESGGRIFENVLNTKSIRKRNGIRADAIKTQQIVMSSYNGNRSEKTEIQKINLTKTLSSSRLKQSAKNSELSVSPTEKGGEGSDRSFLKTVSENISLLHRKANAGEIIKESDVIWLQSLTALTSFHNEIALKAVRIRRMNRISQIFLTIVKKQLVSVEIMTKLCKNFLKFGDDSSSDECRMTLLKTFEIYSIQNNGNIPRKMEKCLNKFLNISSVCTKDMRRMIWKIVSKNDKNVDMSFPIALEYIQDLQNKIFYPEYHLEQLEFLARQISVEQRAILLEEKFKFLEKLLNIVQDEQFHCRVRIEVLEMVEDYLVFDRTGLNSNWLQIFLRMYKSAILQDNSHVESELEFHFDDFDKPDILERFKTSFIRCVLNTLNKPESIYPETIVLELLVDTAVKNIDRKLESLILVTLGNLVSRPIPFQIPNVQRLASKLLVRDTIDQHEIIHLFDNDEDDTNHNQTFISSIVANILLQSFRSKDQNLTESTFQILFQTLEESRDDTTRILCSECLFKASQIQQFSQIEVTALRPLILDTLFEVQFYASYAYCTALYKLCQQTVSGRKFEIELQDMNLLPTIYSYDQTMFLGEINFSDDVNPVILKILRLVAPTVQFSDENFKLMNFILNDVTSSDREICLEIISHQCRNFDSYSDFSFPVYIFETIESVFQSELSLYSLSASVLIKVSRKLGLIFSDSTLEFAQQNLMTPENSNEMKTSLSIIFQAQNNQDLPEFIFNDFEMQFIGYHLLFLIQMPVPEFSCSDQDAQAISSASKVEMGNMNFKQEILNSINGALQIFQNYLRFGGKCSILLFELMYNFFILNVHHNDVIQCLIYTAENGQSLAARLVEIIFLKFQPNLFLPLDENLQILTLALGLVQNNQSLPESFVNHLVDRFCATRRRMTGEDEEYDKILFTLAKLAQQSLTKLSCATQLVQNFCNVWKSNSISQCHQQQLEILLALKGFVNTNRDEINLKGIHEIFVDAAKNNHFQIQETAVNGLITLNWNGAEFFTQNDFEMFLTILSERDVSPSMKKRVAEFLSHNLEKLPEIFKREFTLLQNLDKLTDSQFLNCLESIVSNVGKNDSTNVHQTFVELSISQNINFISRLESLLLQKDNQDISVVVQALSVIEKISNKENFPPSIFESIALALLSNSKSSNIQKSGKSILIQLTENLQKFTESPVMEKLITPKLIEYLKLSKQHDDLLLKVFDLGNIEEDQFWIELKLKNDVHSFIKKMKNLEWRKRSDRKSLSKQFEIETLDSVNFDNLKLDSKTVNKFIKFYGENLFQPSREFAKMIAVYVIDAELTGSEYDCKGSCAIVEECILSQELSLHPIVFKAYTYLIERRVDRDLCKCLKVMTTLFEKLSTRPNDQLHELDQMKMSNIISCIMRGINFSTGKEESFIPIESVKLLVDQLIQDQKLTIRQQSFRGLIHLRRNCIKADSVSNPNEQIPMGLLDFSKIVWNIYVKIFQDEEKASQEIRKDGKFAINLLDLLYSLKFWDFPSLQRIQDKPQKWRKTLRISNFISCFARSQNEKLEMVLSINDLYRNHGNQQKYERDEDETTSEEDGDKDSETSTSDIDPESPVSDEEPDEILIIGSQEYFQDPDLLISRPERILTALTHLLTMETSRSVNLTPQLIIRILQTLSKLPYSDVRKILMNPLTEFEKDQHQFLIQIEESAIASLLSKKVKLKLNSHIRLALSKKFVMAAGIEYAQDLVKSLVQVQDLADIDELIRTLKLARESIKCGHPLHSLFKDLDSGIESKFKIQDMIVLLKTQMLLNDLPASFNESTRFQSIFKSLLKNGISCNQIRNLFNLSMERTGNNHQKIFEHITFQAHQYQISSKTFDEIVTALENLDSVLRWNIPDCIDTCNRIINDFTFDALGLRSIDQITSEFCTKNPNYIVTLKNNSQINLVTLIGLVHNCNKRSKIFGEKKLKISKWSIGDIKEWSRVVKKDGGLAGIDFIIESMMVAKRAFLLQTKFHMTNIQILTCLSCFLQMNPKGKLLQVATGSGKSAIIAIIAVIKCLQTGQTVDIYTSSSVLAERDAKEWSTFYSLFEITCDHNGDKTQRYISGEKACYQNDIVYGDCAQFQFDYLRHTYSDLDTLGDRECCYAIIDEVDSMFIDDSSKLARLSSTVPGMDLVHPLYHFMWNRMSFIKTHLFKLFDQIYYLEGKTDLDGVASQTSINLGYTFVDPETSELMTIPNVVEYIIGRGDLKKARIHKVENVESFVQNHLENYTLALISNKEIPGFSDGKEPKVKLPKNLQTFAETQIPKWVDSCITAIAFQENIHYIIDDGQVKPVDFNTTGIVQGNTNWNNGFHQFLQIQHGLKLNSESVTTNFLSNMAMFKKYGVNLVGFTGTLGSDSTWKVFHQVYNVDLMVIPEAHNKRHVSFPGVVVSNENEWLKEIVFMTLGEVAKKRGVLIICETIKQANLVSERLKKFKKVNVKLYSKNMKNQEKQIERIHPGDVIVATNLAGRGTDIKTVDIEKYGGLHVCLTFLPKSLRVEEQAFGRTSRQGNWGTSQLIIQAPPALVELNEKKMTLSTEYLSQMRDIQESEELDQFQSQDLGKIQMKDELFANFCHLFSQIRSLIRKEQSVFQKTKDKVTTVLRRPSPTAFEVIHLQAVEERWAMFLRKMDNLELPAEKVDQDYQEFERKLLDDHKKGQLILNSDNLFYLIQLGNFEFKRDSKFNRRLNQAKKYFEEAIKLDSNFSAGAYAGQAYVLLKGKKNLVSFDNHENGYKEMALKSLYQACPLLNNEMAQLMVIHTFIQNQNGGNVNTPIFKQVTEKFTLLGSYLKNIQETISTIRKSLRQVRCTYLTTEETSSKKMNIKESQLIPDSIIQSKKEIPWTQFQNYHLTFHDLTVREDSGVVHDQAINTISSDDHLDNIKLTCHQLDLASFLENEKISQHQFDLDITLLGVQLHEDGKLNFDDEKLGMKPNHYNFTIDLALSNQETTQVKVPPVNAVKNLEMELHFFSLEEAKKLIKFDKNHNKEKILLFTDLKKTVQNYEGQVSLKFLKVNHSAKISRLIKLVKSSSGLTINNLSLTLKSVERNPEQIKSIKSTWNDYLKEHFSQIVIHFRNLDKNGVKFLIPALRKLNNEVGTWFTLQCRDLCLKTAQLILRKADIEQEDIEQKSVQELRSLFMSDHLPLNELIELSARGISLIVTFNERAFVPWISVMILVGLAAAQTAVGAAMIGTGFGATVGMGLITEGMADLVQAHRVYFTRQFSWRSYGIQKAVSLAISAISMGLSAIKDSTKVVSVMAQGTTEIVEQAGTRVIVNGRALSTAISVAGTNLNSLAIKQVAVATAETGARIALKSLADSLTDFTFEKLRDSISGNVSIRVADGFRQPNLQKILSFYYALDPNKLNDDIQSIVLSTTNPKSIKWLQLWSTVGVPLCAGLLSSPQFLGSSVSRITLMYGVVSGMKEIGEVVNRVCQEILNTLTKKKPDVATILHSHAGLSKEISDRIAAKIVFKDDFEVKEFPLPSDFSSIDEWTHVQNVLNKLDGNQKGYKIENSDVSQMMRSVVESITSHIIKIANSHIVSPAMSMKIGKLVSTISAGMQDSFLVNENQNTRQQNLIKEKVEELKRKTERTKEEEDFIDANDRKNTFANQINFNAKDFTIAWQKREIIAKIMEKRPAPLVSNEASASVEEKYEIVSAKVQEKVDDILTDGHADIALMFLIASKNELNIKMIDDPNYQLTLEEKKGGVKVLIFQRGEDDDQIGYYSIKTSDEKIIDFIDDNGSTNSGWNCMSHLTGKSDEELRIEIASHILDNPNQFQEIQKTCNWLKNHHPQQVCDVLMLGSERYGKYDQQLELLNGSQRQMQTDSCPFRLILGEGMIDTSWFESLFEIFSSLKLLPGDIELKS